MMIEDRYDHCPICGVGWDEHGLWEMKYRCERKLNKTLGEALDRWDKEIEELYFSLGQEKIVLEARDKEIEKLKEGKKDG